MSFREQFVGTELGVWVPRPHPLWTHACSECGGCLPPPLRMYANMPCLHDFYEWRPIARPKREA